MWLPHNIKFLTIADKVIDFSFDDILLDLTKKNLVIFNIIKKFENEFFFRAPSKNKINQFWNIATIFWEMKY